MAGMSRSRGWRRRIFFPFWILVVLRLRGVVGTIESVQLYISIFTRIMHIFINGILCILCICTHTLFKYIHRYEWAPLNPTCHTSHWCTYGIETIRHLSGWYASLHVLCVVRLQVWAHRLLSRAIPWKASFSRSSEIRPEVWSGMDPDQSIAAPHPSFQMGKRGQSSGRPAFSGPSNVFGSA